MSEHKKSAAKPRLFTIFFIAALVLAAFAAVGQIIISIHYYDETLHLYQRDANVPTCFYIVVAAGLAVLGASALTTPKDMKEELPDKNSLTVFTGTLCAFFMAASVVLNILYYLRDIFPDLSAFRIVTLVFAVLAAAYFLAVSSGAKINRNIIAVLGFFVILWAITDLLGIYFEMNSPLNSPVRIMSQLSLLAVMLFFVYEIRSQLGVPKPRLHIMFGCISIPVIALYAIPNVVLTFAGFRTADYNTVFSMAQCCILLYIAARMAQRIPRNKTEEE